MPKGIPLTEEEIHNRRVEISQAAVRLILEKGFQETSMREIAQAAGMGKSSLYDYFRTKDEILIFVLEEKTAELNERARAIANLNLPPDERLRRIEQMHLQFMQENQNLFSRLSFQAQRLKVENQKRIQKGRYAFQDMVAEIIQEGIDQGIFRAVNPLNSARLLVNSIVSVLYTTRPTGTPEEMQAEAVDIFLKGIKK